MLNRSGHQDLGKGVLKICSKFTGQHPCRSVITTTLLHILRTVFPKNISGGLLLKDIFFINNYLVNQWPYKSMVK